MIKLTELSITEFRGIRSLTLAFNGESFAISGRNGTGKSGVVDAIQFALTGKIARLSGSGTNGLSPLKHGPHVDVKDNPAKAIVSLTFSVPSKGITNAKITRSVADHGHPTVSPNTPEVRAALAEIAAHPEFALSRRNLILYILSEAGKRSEHVQTLLQLERVGELRQLLVKISNAEERKLKVSRDAVSASENRLNAAMGVAEASIEAVTDTVNQRRLSLGLEPVVDLLTPGALIGALSEPSIRPSLPPKEVWLGNIDSAQQALEAITSNKLRGKIRAAAVELIAFHSDPGRSAASEHEDLLEHALTLFDGEECPVCHHEWESTEFIAVVKEHLIGHRRDSTELHKIKDNLEEIASAIAAQPTLIVVPAPIGSKLEPAIDTDALRTLKRELDDIVLLLRVAVPGQATIDALSAWPEKRTLATDCLDSLAAAVRRLPEVSATNVARDYLVAGQGHVDAWVEALANERSTASTSRRAKHVYDTYETTTKAALTAIYTDVQDRFAQLYALVNDDDEAGFTACLIPNGPSLDLTVDFYGRGPFPPGAYHSEGHQDSMGICLYLALMESVLGDNFSFAVLDDVLMSVDAGHRRALSEMLKSEFPNTQFILTTHDRVWLRSMITQSLIGTKSFKEFRTWSIDSGPTDWEGRSVWGEIRELARSDHVPTAAWTLREYLEYESRELCQNLRAEVPYRDDQRFQLEDLLVASTRNLKKYYKAAKNAAQSWQDPDAVSRIQEVESRFSELVVTSKVESWQVNTSVHYNSWADLQPKEFEPVIDAYEDLLEGFRCPTCRAFLHVTPPSGSTPEVLLCLCGATSYMLTSQPKKS